MRLLLLAASAAALLSTPALAQDWGGPYVSGFVGYAWGDSDDSEVLLFDTNQDGSYGDQVNTAAPANAFSPGFCDGTAQGATPAAGCAGDDDSGFDYGARIGYDWQSGGMVFGVLGEFSRADIQDSVSGFSTTPARYTMNREVNYVTAVRGRLGFTADPVLVYATAGIAWADVEHDFTTSNGANSFTERGDDSAQGYQLGAGVDWAMSDRMSFGAEYVWTELEDDDYTVRAGPGSAGPTNPFLIVNPTGTDIQRSNDQIGFGSLRLTATYRF